MYAQRPNLHRQGVTCWFMYLSQAKSMTSNGESCMKSCGHDTQTDTHEQAAACGCTYMCREMSCSPSVIIARAKSSKYYGTCIQPLPNGACRSCPLPKHRPVMHATLLAHGKGSCSMSCSHAGKDCACQAGSPATVQRPLRPHPQPAACKCMTLRRCCSMYMSMLVFNKYTEAQILLHVHDSQNIMQHAHVHAHLWETSSGSDTAAYCSVLH